MFSRNATCQHRLAAKRGHGPVELGIGRGWLPALSSTLTESLHGQSFHEKSNHISSTLRPPNPQPQTLTPSPADFGWRGDSTLELSIYKYELGLGTLLSGLAECNIGA